MCVCVCACEEDSELLKWVSGGWEWEDDMEGEVD